MSNVKDIANFVSLANTLITFLRNSELAAAPAIEALKKATLEGRDLTSSEVSEANARADLAGARARGVL